MSDLLHTLSFLINLVGTLPYILTSFSYDLEVANMYINEMQAVLDAHFNCFMCNGIDLIVKKETGPLAVEVKSASEADRSLL